jgi:hypothetical protein
MGSRSALKMTGSLSRASICRSREQYVVIEPPKSKRGKMLVWKLVKEKKRKTQSKDEVEKEGVPTSYCQSIITSFLSVRVARMMEKNRILLTGTSPRYPITTHGLAFLIDEGIQPSISLEVITILLHGLLPHSKN